MSRYARQTILPEVGETGQTALRAATIVVVGVGGLGSPALQYLVAAGVGRVILVDGDTVSLSNLHRQTLFREADIGQPKAAVAARRLAGLNAECSITPVLARLTPRTAPDLVGQADVVLDCADSFAASYILSDHCAVAARPLISASALGFDGYVGGFCGAAPSLRAVFPDLPERAASCATAGVLGPVVGMVGAMQAQMALTVLLGLSPSPLGQLTTCDLRNFRTGGFRFDAAPEPEGTPLGFIDVADIRPSDFVVDLRDAVEAPDLVTPQAQRRAAADFPALCPKPEPGQRAVLACRSGLRSWQAATRLSPCWDGPISLIAMGDPPETER